MRHIRWTPATLLARWRSALLPLLVLSASLNIPPGGWLLSASSAASQQRKETVNADELLTPGLPVSRTLNGGETHSFKIQLVAGQFLSLRVIHRGVILIATLTDPNGKELVEMNNPSGGHGLIYLSTIGETSGECTLKLQSTEDWANPGTYEVVIQESRAASPADQERVPAERDFAEGSKQFKKEEREAFQKARVSYETALTKWDRIRDDHWRAMTRYILGVTHRRLGERPKAEKYFLETLEIQLGEVDWRLRAAALNDLGFTNALLGKKDEALAHLNQALSSFEAHQDGRGQASTLNNIALTHARAGERELARKFYEKALPLRRAERDKNGELNLINNIGGIHDTSGEPYEARARFKEALAGWQELDRRGKLRELRQLGQAFNNVAVANDKLNEWQDAFDNYAQALKVFERIGDVANQASVLDNIGELHASLGDPDRALEYYERARLLVEISKDPDATANVLTHIGQAYISQGKFSDALVSFEAALKLNPKPSAAKLANVSTNLGAVYALQQKYSQALVSYEIALPIWTSIGDRRGEAATLQKRGEAYLGMGDRTKAGQDFTAALSVWKLLVDQRGQAAALNGLARIEQGSRQPEGALTHSEEAINIAESLRTRVSSQRLRASYFATQQEYYEVNVDLKMELYRAGGPQKYLEAAFESSERARARGLIDILSESDKDLTFSISPELLRRQREIKRRIAGKEQAQAKLLNGKPTRVDVEAFNNDLVKLVAEHDDVDTQIKASNPRYADLIRSRPSTTAEIQEQLDRDTLLLEYSLGEKRSYVWAVTPDSIQGFELPAREKIEEVAHRFRAALTARNQQVENESGEARNDRVKRADAESVEAAKELTKLVLEPVASLLGRKRLVIVADGALQLVPFATLPAPVNALAGKTTPKSRTPKNNALTNQSRWLVDDHELVSIPSASVLAVQRRELANRKPAPHAVAVLADPVFDEIDVQRELKLRSAQKAVAGRRQPAAVTLGKLPTANTTTLDLSRALRDVGIERIAWLPFSRPEAEAILKLAPRGEGLGAFGFEASRAIATSPQLADYRIIHFATHGMVNFEHPELSGIVLSTIDEKSQPQDGFLRLHAIYNLNLPAELVVLSACETGVGKQIKGEGLIALTRGFMYAGAPRVVASLWKVNDAATADLMREFYTQMFTHKRTPAAALREAQRKLSRDRRWGRSPYYWAGFVLQGEWK